MVDVRLTKLVLILVLAFFSFWCKSHNSAVPKKFTFDDDGMLVLEGKRTFIIGSYHLPKSEQPFQELSEAGFNYVHVAANEEQLDLAQQNNLWAWISLGAINSERADETSEIIKNKIRQFKAHPALLCWETIDEPAFIWNSAKPRFDPELLIETHRLIKKEDDQHFVYVNHAPVNLISTLQIYNPASDIVACDIYPVIPHGIRPQYALFPDGLQGDLLNPYLSQVGEYVDKMRRVTGNGKPLFMVLQGFAWEMLRDDGDRDPTMIKYPTFEETRFMAYNAIIHGSNGILYWGIAHTPQPSPFWSDLKKVASELALLQTVLAARNLKMKITKTYHEVGHSVDAGVEILAKQNGADLFLITANVDKNPIKVTLGGLEKYRHIEVLLEGRALVLDRGKLTENYRPFDVHVYKLY